MNDCVVGPDGYCETHGIVGKHASVRPIDGPRVSQLDRIEAKLNKILRVVCPEGSSE